MNARAQRRRQTGNDRLAQLKAALAQHHRGQVGAALDGYRTVLRRWPDDPDALHLQGLALHQCGQHVPGLDSIDKALALKPDAPSFHANRGLALKALGQDEAARAAFRRALALQPDHPDAGSNLGAALIDAGDLEGAIAVLQAAVGRSPRLLAPRLNLVRALQLQGETDAAVAQLDEMARLAPHDPAVLLARAQGLVAAGRHDAAVIAAAAARRALPASADALTAHAAALLGRGEAAAAVTLAQQALASQPEHDDALATLGAALVTLDRDDEALPVLERVVAQRPLWTSGWSNLGHARSRAAHHAGALAAHRRAIATAPRDAAAHAGLGNAAQAAGAFDVAVAAYRDAVALAPDNPAYRLGLGLLHLLLDKGAEGWPAYAARWDCEGFTVRRPLPQPAWNGEPLAGLRLAVTGEQGVGDEIMMAGLVPELVAAGATVVLEAHHRLVPLFARSFAGLGVTVVPALDPPAPALAETDRQVAAGDLLAHLRPSIAAAPAWPAYLKADPAAVSAVRARLAGFGTGLKVGLAWRSGNASNGRRRSLPLARWLPLLRRPGACFVNLQYGDCHAALEALHDDHGIRIHRDAAVDPLADLDGFAALVSALDLVISIDNSTVHIAGAVGVPCWALLPVSPDWRWLTEGDEDRWYKSVRLFRQEIAGDWEAPLAAVGAALDARLQDRPLPTAPRRPPAPKRPRALLLNDTSDWYHWGCTGTSTALRREITGLGFALETLPINVSYALDAIPRDIDGLLSGSGFAAFHAANPVPFRAIADADVVLINGEGTLHGDAPVARGLLALAHAATARFDKPVQIVNHSCYPPDDPAQRAFYAEVYRRLDHVAVREHRAYAAVASLGVTPHLAFDCLPLFIGQENSGQKNIGQEGIRRDKTESNRLLLAGSASIAAARIDLIADYIARMRQHGFSIGVLTGAAAFPAVDDRLFVERLRHAAPAGWDLVETASAQAWLRAIAEADLFFSGRFHHSIAAMTLGTPFVAMRSNTAKIDALLELTEFPPALPSDAPDLAAQLERASLAVLATPFDAAEHGARIEALRLLAQVNFDGLRCMQRTTE